MLGNKFKVRVAELKDLPTVLLMVYDYLQETEGTVLDDAKKDQVRLAIMSGIATGSAIVLLAEIVKKHKAREVGYGIFDIRPDIMGNWIGWGHHLYIKPEYRHSVVADKLIASAELLAERTGADEFYIDTAMPDFFRKRKYEDKYVVLFKKLKQPDGGANV